MLRPRAAHRRLIFEELFFLELGLELKRRRMRERMGISFATTDKVREAIREVLPFHPTAAQKRALGEIVSDMRSPSPDAAACCRAMWDQVRRSLLSKPCWWQWRTATRPR